MSLYENYQDHKSFSDLNVEEDSHNLDHKKRIRKILEERLERNRLKKELDDEFDGEFDWSEFDQDLEA